MLHRPPPTPTIHDPRTSRGVHTIRTHNHIQADRLVRLLKATKLSPTRETRSKRGHLTRHVTPPRSSETTSTPILPNRTHLTTRSWAAPTSPHRHLRTRHPLTPPPAETVHQHRRLEPSSLENLLGSAARHRRTSPQATCHEGQEVAGGDLADSPPLKPLPHPTTNNHNPTSPRGNPVTMPCRHPIHDTGNR